MSVKKLYRKQDVLGAARERIKLAFDEFEQLYISFSAGKDSSVMFHLVMEEAMRRKRKVGVLFIDLEAQYTATIDHAREMFDHYKDYIDLYWVCLPMALRNAVSNFEPRWVCWDEEVKVSWVRELPSYTGVVNSLDYFPFFRKGMEFEEFMVEFGFWYSRGQPTGAFVGIRTDESLNRFRTIASDSKTMLKDYRWTTLVNDSLYNVYPIYDWKTSDLWLYHAKYPDLKHNQIYDLMHRAGLSPSQMRLCQPYGDDQRRGLWLFHILEPATWYKVVSRINGVNSGTLYIQETGNINGYNKITKPDGHTWKSFCNLLLQTLPKKTRDHYISKFQVFLKWWKKRGYSEGIPDEAPLELENKKLAPSYRRLCKVILRNDYWCKGLNFTQPRSVVYGEYLKLKKGLKTKWDAIDLSLTPEESEMEDVNEST